MNLLNAWHLSLPYLPLASLVSWQVLQQALEQYGYLAIALFIMIESMGIPMPGETMLLLGAFYAGIDPRLQVPLVIISAAVGAIIGDNLGYLIGRKGGRPLIEKYGHYLFIKKQSLKRTEQFFAKHGGKTVLFGRFIAVLRAWAAFLAGVNHMHWRTFLLYNATGGVLWACGYGLLGYFAGRFFHDNFAAVEHLASLIGWAGAGVILLITLAAIVIWRVRKQRSHKQIAQPAPEHAKDPSKS